MPEPSKAPKSSSKATSDEVAAQHPSTDSEQPEYHHYTPGGDGSSRLGPLTQIRPGRRGAMGGMGLAIGLVGGLIGAFIYVHDFAGSIPTSKKQIIVQESSAVVDVAKAVSPSVVSITSQEVTTGFFGLGSQTQEGDGTGIILTSDGLILTNNHVISGAQTLTVFLSNGKQYKGSVVATDTIDDYAFVRINASGLTPAKLGDSSNVEIGQRVIAIGNALGQYQNTVTDGIISGKGRPVTASDQSGAGSESLQDLFQTDAAINPGNSGGPLVNLDGQVIGMNTAVAGNAQNIGFAIPINDISAAITSVEKGGTIQKPYLGVRYVSITQDVATADNLPVTSGAYITGDASNPAVVPGSPAAAAGLQSGDIITKVGSTAIDQDHSLTSLLSQKKVGDKVTLTYLRSGKTKTITVTLGAAPTNS